MIAPEQPKGQKFSLVYLDRGKPVRDSDRFRRRLGAFLDQNLLSAGRAIAEQLAIEVGERPRLAASNRYDWSLFIGKITLHDLLDSMPVIIQTLIALGWNTTGADIEKFCNKAFLEENLCYQMDALGGVHYYADQEFEVSRNTTVAALAGMHNDAAREAIEESHAALRKGDTLLAVRRAFDAVENRFKIDYNTSRIGVTEVKQKLTPVVEARYEGRVADAAKRMIVSLAEWTNASHQFRHAPDTADPSPPPEELALLMISEAMAYVRWLVSLAAK